MKSQPLLIALLFNLFFLNAQITSQTQIISKRISINNPSKALLLQVKDAGIDLSCGASFKNNNLILELGGQQLKELDARNITYSVLIDDLIGYFKNQSKTQLPLAKQQLAQLKSQPISQKSLSTQSATIDNIIQYEGCSEINWTTPQNFQLGSMAGCLTYSEMLAQLDLMRTKYPGLISVKTDASPGTVTHGNSYTNGGAYNLWAGQPIYYVKISDNPDIDEPNEPESLYTGMTHSREVNSMMNLIYYMWYLLENYSTNSGIKNLVDHQAMYFIPVANPDGLMWNEQIAPSGGGMQRKNLGPYNTGNNAARGVDLNRNFDYFWGSNAIYGGSSSTASSDVYRGPSAFSEPETQIIKNFTAGRNFKTAMNNHAYSNLIPHAYNGYPAAPPSGRESEYNKFCQDMTRFNRYIYGEAPDILTIANGDESDWMLGGVADVNGSTGSGKAILALSPESGAWDGSEGGFWPNPTQIVNIAKRAMRMNFVNAYYSGKFAQFHDLNSSDVTSTSGNFNFGIEYLGQTLGNITLNVTPVSSNIIAITPPATQTGWSKLEQRTVTASYTLNAGIQANDKIEFQITLSNDDGYVMYQANIIKYYNPTILTVDNPDVTGISNWTTSGGSWGTTTDAYSGSTAITDSPSGSYSNNINKSIKYNTAVDLSSSAGVVVQYYAKWDLERNFDYVQIQGSTDGTNWTTLCGKYTKPGSDILTTRYSSTYSTNTSTGKSTADQNNQPTGDLLYDGDTMDKWVMEEIYIDNTNNSFLFNQSNVQFRFLFDSDSTNRADGYPTTFDGFIFDDFKIISIQIPCAVSVPTGLNASTITTVSATINWDNIPSSTYDIQYREIGSPTWNLVTNISTNSQLISGLISSKNYEVQVRSRCTSSTSSFTTSFNFTTANVVACTGSVVSSFPYTESFEGGNIGLWSQGVNGTDDDIDWTNNINGTSSSGTGPSAASNGTRYLYTEASSPNFPSKLAELISPCFELTGYENSQFSFDYHMYGANIGTLSLEISIDNGASYSSLFSISGQQQTSNSDAWKTQIVDLAAFNGQIIKLKFNGLTGSGFSSDIAIDNINLTASIASTTWYADADNDTYGDPGVSQVAAIQPVGYVLDNTDCDDTNATINPATVWYLDADSDNYAISTMTGCTSPGVGYTQTVLPLTDCDDTNATINPGATEIICNGIDENCNGMDDDMDIISPICNAKDITVQLDAGTGTVTITGADIDNGSTDNCGIASLVANPNTFDNNNIGDNIVTLTVTDFNGNSSKCDIIVTVKDSALAIDENDIFNVAIYPNPFRILLNIRLPQLYLGNSIKIEIFDFLGRSITSFSKLNRNGLIQLNEFRNFTDASYFIKVTDIDSNKTVYKQIVKK